MSFVVSFFLIVGIMEDESRCAIFARTLNAIEDDASRQRSRRVLLRMHAQNQTPIALEYRDKRSNEVRSYHFNGPLLANLMSGRTKLRIDNRDYSFDDFWIPGEIQAAEAPVSVQNDFRQIEASEHIYEIERILRLERIPESERLPLGNRDRKWLFVEILRQPELFQRLEYLHRHHPASYERMRDQLVSTLRTEITGVRAKRALALILENKSIQLSDSNLRPAAIWPSYRPAQ